MLTRTVSSGVGRAPPRPGAVESTQGQTDAVVVPSPAATEAVAQERCVSNAPQHHAWDEAPGLHRCSDKDQRKWLPDAATIQQGARPSAWRSAESDSLPDQLAAGAGTLDAGPPFKRSRTGNTPPEFLRSPPVVKAQASHSKDKVNPKYSSPSPGFWEEAIRMCSDYEPPELNEARAAVQVSARASPAEGRGSSRAGPRPLEGQATLALQQSKQSQEIFSPVPVRRFDFHDHGVVKAEPEMGGSAGPPFDGTDHCHDVKPSLVPTPQPGSSLPVKGASPGPAMDATAGPAAMERAPSSGNEAEAGGPAPFEQQGRQHSRSSEDSVCGTGGILDGSGGRGGANEAGTSALSAEELEREKELSHWLPDEACAVYARKGVTRMYEWQVSKNQGATCLSSVEKHDLA